MSEQLAGPGTDLALAFATWAYILHSAGLEADDAELVQACVAVRDAPDREAGDEAGMTLVRRIIALLGEGEPAVEQVLGMAAALYGERLSTDLGEGSREDRASRIRRYQFAVGLPWLARIYERQADGQVGPTWLLIERVSDVVRVMDPNPWDDVDEERDIPWADFQVLWELAGCPSARINQI